MTALCQRKKHGTINALQLPGSAQNFLLILASCKIVSAQFFKLIYHRAMKAYEPDTEYSNR